jgi:Protein of unknown function (DUF1579)
MSEVRNLPKPLPPELEVLAADLGTWDAEVRVRPAPGVEALPTKGVLINRFGCGGRWLISDFRNDSGFEGHGIHGYDAAKRCYVGTWVDTERTFLGVAEGTWDAAARTMTYHWEATVGGRTMRWREVTEKGQAGVLVFRQFMPLPGGGEYEMITTTYRRRT